ncbi:hypothetical protein [Sediminitomix flava]|uniref:Cep192/Spd-2-like domain-containing protein n=1 Tax=Sediminitomix flava TaxID=379075 RepID=A0A315Z5L2_SEDFL|nr:hypothetical protein [Sediminitomix flava]PWJ39137.1 hypothetical protein BC781_10638 [Sediminitomix flava]
MRPSIFILLFIVGVSLNNVFAKPSSNLTLYYESDGNWIEAKKYIDFGSIPVNNSKTLKLKLSNTSSKEINITDLSFLSKAPFSVRGLEVSTPFTLKRKKALEFKLNFKPNSAQAFQHQLSLNYILKDSAVFSIAVKGSGVDIESLSFKKGDYMTTKGGFWPSDKAANNQSVNAVWSKFDGRNWIESEEPPKGYKKDIYIMHPIKLRKSVYAAGKTILKGASVNLNGYNLILGMTGSIEEQTSNAPYHIFYDDSEKDGGKGMIVANQRSIDYKNLEKDIAGLGIFLQHNHTKEMVVDIWRGHRRIGRDTKSIRKYFEIQLVEGHIEGGSLMFKYTPSDYAEISDLKDKSERFTLTHQTLDWEYGLGIPHDQIKNCIAHTGTELAGVWTISPTKKVQVYRFEGVSLGSIWGYEVDMERSRLLWSTMSEENVRKFEVQKCHDGVIFYPVGNMMAKGYNHEVQYYTFNDFEFDKSCYYRLKIIREDGTYEYSPLQFVVRRDDFKPIPSSEFVPFDQLPDTPPEAYDEISFRIPPKFQQLWLKLYSESGDIVFSAEGKQKEVEELLNKAFYNLQKDTYLLEFKVNEKLGYAKKVIVGYK